MMTSCTCKNRRTNQMRFGRKFHGFMSFVDLLGETHVRDIDGISLPACAHQKVVRLDISMDQFLLVQILQSANQLICYYQTRFEGESMAAVAEQVFQAWSKKFKYQSIVFALGSEPVDFGDSDTASKPFIDLVLLSKISRLDGPMFKLDSHFFIGIRISSLS
jgi:hypothetical protein